MQIQNRPTSCGYVLNAIYMNSVLQKYFEHSVPITDVLGYFNLLKPTGYVMHQQFNTQKLYALLTLYLSVLYLSENKQRIVPLTA
jgi:hypothetical protein